ncbi:hypothetical protein [Paraburkholderia sacchari]|uniref:hypothetical protein n=1 Tax=Paraburkholderia sacchari TaxID=159450 RepID=UPI000542B4A5|nr:hypothetical protein [Paraburkholderia sacchari]NLP64354.1 hypothetical protein [Paraburkholderia sacchari]
MDDLEARVELAEQALRDTCERNGFRVTVHGEISEHDAALLLRYAGPSALRMQANEGRSVVRIRLVGARRWHRLADLARYLETPHDE